MVDAYVGSKRNSLNPASGDEAGAKATDSAFLPNSRHDVLETMYCKMMGMDNIMDVLKKGSTEDSIRGIDALAKSSHVSELLARQYEKTPIAQPYGLGGEFITENRGVMRDLLTHVVKPNFFDSKKAAPKIDAMIEALAPPPPAPPEVKEEKPPAEAEPQHPVTATAAPDEETAAPTLAAGEEDSVEKSVDALQVEPLNIRPISKSERMVRKGAAKIENGVHAAKQEVHKIASKKEEKERFIQEHMPPMPSLNKPISEYTSKELKKIEKDRKKVAEQRWKEYKEMKKRIEKEQKKADKEAKKARH